MKAVLATGNAHKIEEIGAVLGAQFELEALATGADESGDTFEENALIKARAAASAAGRLALADDSGLEVDALGGQPGVHSARWTAEGNWTSRVLRELDGVRGDARSARFITASAAVWSDGREVVVRGSVDGHIASGPRGVNGFGYDPIFVPDEGDGRTFAEMTAAEKHARSHRGRAFRALAERLTNL